MKIEAEQFLFPFDRPGQREFLFIPSVSIFDGWGVVEWFTWSAVLLVESIPGPDRSGLHGDFIGLLPALVDHRRRVGFCVLGVLSFR